jgi:Secretion system C-terminal sorting domain
LPPGNNVSFCYLLMQWASGDSSGGSAGFDGAPAYVGVNKGDGTHFAQFGAFDLPGYTWTNPFDTASGIYWLNNKTFDFSTCVSGDLIPPVLVNPDSCESSTICVGDTVIFNAFFLCSQKGQTITLSVNDSGLTGLLYATGRVDSLYRITARLIASLSDTGTHTIGLTATDNSSPPLTNSSLFKVTILNCNDSGLGIHELNTQTPSVKLFPNPNNGQFTIQVSGLSNYPDGNLESVEVYNMLGEQVYCKFNLQNSECNIDLSSQPAGVYFYRIISDSGSLVGDGKFVIQ